MANSATFVKVDTTTQGNWKTTFPGNSLYSRFVWPGAYSVWGFMPPPIDPVTHGWAVQINRTTSRIQVWEDNSSDSRSLQDTYADTGRIAACLFNDTSFAAGVFLMSGPASRQVALYFLDFDALGRSLRVDVRDAGNGDYEEVPSGAILDTRTVNNFFGGQYLIYNVTGKVKFQITSNGILNAVLSGILVSP